MLKVIAFDVFGTVFDLSSVPHEEIKDYADHIRKPEWSPLKLPKSWEKLPAHKDSRMGIEELYLNYTVVTMSNGPVELLSKISKRNFINWDFIVPLELKKVYKPDPKAYMMICEVFDVQPSEVMMVTANEHFGDIEAATKLGMVPKLIRNNTGLDISGLAEELGC